MYSLLKKEQEELNDKITEVRIKLSALTVNIENAEKDIDCCPKCGSDHIDTIQRITGYLVGTVESWNDGKRAELKDRVCHG